MKRQRIPVQLSAGFAVLAVLAMAARGATIYVSPGQSIQAAINNANDDDEIEVFYVSPNTPAARAKFEEGDIIKAVNDIPLELMDGVIALRELFKAEAGTEYRLEIRRDGRSRSIKIKLRDLF